jgi:hypothetical protein
VEDFHTIGLVVEDMKITYLIKYKLEYTAAQLGPKKTVYCLSLQCGKSNSSCQNKIMLYEILCIHDREKHLFQMVLYD